MNHCNFCRQFGPRSGSKLFDTLIIFLKEFFEKVDFEKNQRTTKKKTGKNIPIYFKRTNSLSSLPAGDHELLPSADNLYKQFGPRKKHEKLEIVLVKHCAPNHRLVHKDGTLLILGRVTTLYMLNFLL